MDKVKRLILAVNTWLLETTLGKAVKIVGLIMTVIVIIAMVVNHFQTKWRYDMCFGEFNTQECIDDRNARWKHEYEVTNKEAYRKYKAQQEE